MYTVLRFLGEDVPRDVFSSLVKMLNDKQPGVFDCHFHRRCSGFSCGVSDSSDWDSHVQQVEEYLALHEDVLRSARTFHVSLEMDICIHPDTDVPEGLISKTMPFPRGLIEQLLNSDIAFVVTVYKVGGDQDEHRS
jgi:hypothetical protein